jgi:hypothetical protein
VDPQRVAIQLALAEIAQRSFASLRQVLATHHIVLDEHGAPLIGGVESNQDSGWHHVYFFLTECPGDRPLPYHLCITVASEPTTPHAVQFVTVVPGTKVRFVVCSDDVQPAHISDRLQLTPTFAALRGSPTRPGSPTVHPQHFWELHALTDSPTSLEARLSWLQRALARAVPELQAMSTVCSFEVAIAYHGWGGNPQFGGIGLAPHFLRFVSSIGASVDVDLWSCGPSMRDSD